LEQHRLDLFRAVLPSRLRHRLEQHRLDNRRQRLDHLRMRLRLAFRLFLRSLQIDYLEVLGRSRSAPCSLWLPLVR
jgi:hypothetical protein